MIGAQASDIDLLICTHYDDDHAGNHGAFPNAQFIAQRLQHEIARAGHPVRAVKHVLARFVDALVTQ